LTPENTSSTRFFRDDELLSLLTPSLVMELMASTFSLIDLLFYGLAIYEGYRLSIRNTA